MEGRNSERNEMQSKSWFVYILLCSNNSYYVGISPNPEKRFVSHKSGKAAKHTKDYPPLKILYKKEFPSKSFARKREIQIKSWSRVKKEKLINGTYV